jgi:hypothetical protein
VYEPLFLTDLFLTDLVLTDLVLAFVAVERRCISRM